MTRSALPNGFSDNAGQAARDFGERVRARRCQEGLTQNELAQRVRISRTYLSQIERGIAQHLSWHIARRLGAVLGLADGQALDYASLPVGLAAFAIESQLPDEDVRMLAAIHYRGHQPATAQRWRALYALIQTVFERCIDGESEADAGLRGEVG